MEKNIRVLVVTLLFAAIVVSYITTGNDGEEPRELDPGAKVVGALQKVGIPVSDLILTDGEQAKLALNVTDMDIPDDQSIALVIYSTPLNMKKFEAANRVVFAVLENDNTTEGVLLFDTTRRAENLLSTTLIYATREKVDMDLGSGLSETEVFNNYQFFTITKSQLVGASQTLHETLLGYNILATQAGVVKGATIKDSFIEADLSLIGDDSTVAYVSFVPQGQIQEMDYVQAIVQMGFEVDPSIDFVVVNNQLALQSEGLVSLYYTDRPTFEKDIAAMNDSITLSHIEYPLEETDGEAE